MISPDIRLEIFSHIMESAKRKNIKLAEINGYTDHVHCLIALSRDMSIGETLQLIKGESSHWINKQQLITGQFRWQDDYWAVSVSESHVEAVKKYIQNQEEHHKKKTFEQEVDQFMKKYGWSWHER